MARYVLWRGEACGLLKVRWPLHVLRGALNVSMLALFSYALKKLDLAEASTLFFHCAANHHGTVHCGCLGERVRASHCRGRTGLAKLETVHVVNAHMALAVDRKVAGQGFKNREVWVMGGD